MTGRLHIIGCGPAGLLLAAAAAAAGGSPVLLCLDERKAQLLRGRGVTLRAGGEAVVRVEARPAQRVGQGTAVLAVRAAALPRAERLVSDSAVRVYIQPSPLLSPRLREGAGLLALYGCVWSVDGSPNVLSYAVSSVRLAAPDGADLDPVLEGAKFLRMGTVEERGDVQALLWDYVASHASTQPVAAVLGTPRLRGSRHAVALVESLAREIMIVMDELGVHKLRSPVDAAHEILKIKGCMPKMMQDIAHRRRTEVEEINGAVVREALRRGLYAPYNDSMYLTVKALEDLVEAGDDSFEALSAGGQGLPRGP